MSEEIQPETGGQGEEPITPQETGLQPEPVLTVAEQQEAQPKPARMTREKWILVASGFVGWFVVNGLVYQSLLNANKGYSEGTFYASLYGGLCLFTVNIGALIILALQPRSRPVAFGILAAWGVNF